MFYGQHIFFSGGSVATFSFYRLQGDVQCSGTAYNYTGNIREKNVEAALMNDEIGHPARVAGFACTTLRQTSADSAIRKGMTRDQVIASFGEPDAIEHKPTMFVYSSRRIIVVFKKGIVTKVVAET